MLYFPAVKGGLAVAAYSATVTSDTRSFAAYRLPSFRHRSVFLGEMINDTETINWRRVAPTEAW